MKMPKIQINKDDINNLAANARVFAKKAFKALKVSVSHNLGLKMLSLVMALCMWSYVITANPDITRSKTLSGVDVYVTGQSVLTSRNLALRTDVSSELTSVRARVKVSQSSFGLANDTNVRAELDLTGIRTTGRQRVTLKGTSVYGEVVQLWPEYVEIEVEELVQRYVPVNVNLTGTDNASFWYSTRVNPTQVTVSGPASVVQTVSSADITLDVSAMDASSVRAEQFVLRDSRGEEITTPLTCSTSSVMVYLDIYPAKTVPIVSEVTEVISGAVPTGYEITSVTVSPDTALIAADQSLLDTIDLLAFSKIDVSNRTSSFTRTVDLSSLNGLKYVSTDQVTVSVTIGEIETTRKFEGISVSFVNGAESLEATAQTHSVDVVITGPYTQVESLQAQDIIATVDLTGLVEGEYDLPVYVTVDNLPGLTCAASPNELTVTLK